MSEGVGQISNAANMRINQERDTRQELQKLQARQQQIEDGDKKSMGALKWAATLGTIGLMGVGTVYGIKSGKFSKIADTLKDKVGKGTQKAANEVTQEVTEKASKVASAVDSETAQKISKMSPGDAAKAVEKQQTKIGSLAADLSTNSSEISKSKNTIAGYNEQIGKLREQLKTTTKSGKITNINNDIRHYEKLIEEENSRLTKLQDTATELTKKKETSEKLITDLKTYNPGAQESIDAQRLARRRKAHGLS